MARFLLYLDEDSDAGGLVVALRTAGLDLVRSSEAGMNGTLDPAQLAYAVAHQRVLYTSNARDFADLHARSQAAGESHPGMLIWPRNRRYGVGEQARRILRVWEALSAEEMRDRAEFLGQWGNERGRT